MNTEPDLFAQLVPTCGECAQLGAAIESGVRYCHGWMMWRWDWERVDPCPYRDQPLRLPTILEAQRAAA